VRIRFHGRIRKFQNSMYILVPASARNKIEKDFQNVISEKEWFEVEVEL
jgi:hypothetical protein